MMHVQSARRIDLKDEAVVSGRPNDQAISASRGSCALAKPARPAHGIIYPGCLAVAAAIVMLMGRPCSAPYQFQRAIDDPFGTQKAQVFEVYGVYAVRGTKLHMASIRRMLQIGVSRLAGTQDANEAWRRFIDDDDIVALNFTRVGGKPLGTNRNLAAVMLQCLYEAGFKPENFMIVGLEDLPPEAEGTRPWRYGWQEQRVDFGTETDHLASWLDEVTAIINIPSIMDDNVVGLRCSLANLSWSILKSPAKLYINQGDPFIPEVYSLDQIGSKVRLNIANGLRILYYNGPFVRQRYVYERGTLIFSLDPVALDRVALGILQQARDTMVVPDSNPPELTASYLQTASSIGLGYDDLNQIDYTFIRQERW